MVARVKKGKSWAASIDFERFLLRGRSDLEFCVVCRETRVSDYGHSDGAWGKLGRDSRECKGGEKRARDYLGIRHDC